MSSRRDPAHKLYQQRWLSKGSEGAQRELARLRSFWQRVKTFDEQCAAAGSPRPRNQRQQQRGLEERVRRLRETSDGRA